MAFCKPCVYVCMCVCVCISVTPYILGICYQGKGMLTNVKLGIRGLHVISVMVTWVTFVYDL